MNGWPRATLAALGSLVLSLYFLQYWTLPKYAAIPQNSISFEVFWSAVTHLVDPGWEDAICFSLPAVCFVAVVALEIRRREFTRLLALCFCSGRATLGLVFLSAVVIARCYFADGEANWAGDGSAHLAFAYAAVECFAAGEIPIWTNLISLGSPYLQYYGFLYFYVVGLVDLAVNHLFTSIKITLGMAHIASALGMYLLVRITSRSRAAGFLGALSYALCFWHMQQVLIMGRFPLSLFYALLPWPLYFFERLRLPTRRVEAVCGGALSLGLLPLVHPGYGFWATLFFALYALLRLCETPRLRQRPILVSTGLLVGAAVLFGAFLTVPMWLERAGTGIAGGITLSGVPDPSWKRVFIWSNLRFPLLPLTVEEAPWYGGYLGLTPFALALIGAILPWRLPRRGRPLPYLAAGICFALTLLLVFGYRLPPLQALPFVTALNAGRYLLFTTFFMSFLAGLGGAALKRWRPANMRVQTLSLPILLLLGDLGPTTFQQPYTFAVHNSTNYPPALWEELRQKFDPRDLPAGQLAPFRLFTNLAQMHPFTATALLAYRSGLPTPQADHRLLMPTMHAFASPFERYLNYLLHLPDPQLLDQDPVALAGLQLLNVNYQLNVDAEHAVVSLMSINTGPAIISARLEQRPPLAPDSTPDPSKHIAAYIDAMGVDIVHKRSDRLFIADLDQTRYLGTDPRLQVRGHRVWHQRAEVDLEVTAPCFARLAYTYAPQLEVRVNDRAITPYRTAAGFIVVPLEAGLNRIALQPRLSPLRQALLGLNILLLAAGAGALIWSRRKT